MCCVQVGVIYQIECLECNAVYTGETGKALGVRDPLHHLSPTPIHGSTRSFVFCRQFSAVSTYGGIQELTAPQTSLAMDARRRLVLRMSPRFRHRAHSPIVTCRIILRVMKFLCECTQQPMIHVWALCDCCFGAHICRMT
ncbi:hypothetical protein Y032_0044g979 [Ancylostoma ceylanicum]|uniref:Uncharacterized protein n=1 Tax=Ancylostoma ceylanicum TaxID=53326 RepID=A0A016UFM4_9BILA|nr:hypothetical protein Y032_0044g979 [Ancylostoma ceylanicum]